MTLPTRKTSTRFRLRSIDALKTDVLPKLRQKATVGSTIRFVGCAQITDEGTDLSPLRVVPFIGEVTPGETP